MAKFEKTFQLQWKACVAVAHIAEQLVDAYAHAKKVNDEGRALMTRDIKVLQAALDTPVPPPHHSLAHSLHLPI